MTSALWWVPIIFYNIFQFGYVWCLFLSRLRLYSFGKIPCRMILYPFQVYIISGCMWYQYVLLLVMVNVLQGRYFETMLIFLYLLKFSLNNFRIIHFVEEHYYLVVCLMVIKKILSILYIIINNWNSSVWENSFFFLFIYSVIYISRDSWICILFCD